MDSQGKKRIVILGGGFGGIYTAMYLEEALKYRSDVEIFLVNRENYFVYQPMLAEVVGGSVGILDTVSPIHRLLRKVHLFVREVEEINLEKKIVFLAPVFIHKPYELKYDHLVLALGNVTDFRNTPGLYEHALPFKNLADALQIRNRVIEAIEAAAIEQDLKLKQQLLTFVVSGGGFSGTEIVAELNDFARKLAKKHPDLNPKEIRVVLIHKENRLMHKELSESLGNYAGEILQKHGVEIRFGKRLQTATTEEAILDDGERIPSKTVISTAPASPNPILEALPLPQIKGKIKTDLTLQVEGSDHLWAIGDCAAIPNSNGEEFCPPTAQYALREAKVLARNILATLQGKEKQPFHFKSLGMMSALGHHCAVGEFFGKLKISGFFAWFLWRTLYWTKLPGFDRKLKVAFSWALDTLIPIESVQLKIAPSQGILRLHFEPGNIVFHEGDVGDYLYIITEGEVEVLKKKEGKDVCIAKLRKGEFFGEIALLNQRTRTATIRASAPTDLLALKKADFGLLIANFRELKDRFETIEKERKKAL